MPVNVGLRVEGGRQLRATLRAAGSDLSDLKAAHREAAAIAANTSAALAPFRTGRLKASVRSSGTLSAGIVRAGRAAVPYAPVIHWGWAAKGITAQPFVSYGAQSSEGTWLPVYQHAVNNALERVHGT